MQQVDMYKVYRQVYDRAWRIKYADHISANKGKALAMAREVAKRIKRKELLLAAEPPKLQVQPSEAKPQGDGEAQEKAAQRQVVGSVVPRDEVRRVPRFMVTRRSKHGEI